MAAAVDRLASRAGRRVAIGPLPLRERVRVAEVEIVAQNELIV